MGQKLRDGANINRSLLALANCINALGKPAAAAKGYVPYRNSKLTRLLKDGLSGNSLTAMIATVAAASDQYSHSINTLKYADRAKEIKTHVVQNVASVESHISDYRRIIDTLQVNAALPHSEHAFAMQLLLLCGMCVAWHNGVLGSSLMLKVIRWVAEIGAHRGTLTELCCFAGRGAATERSAFSARRVTTQWYWPRASGRWHCEPAANQLSCQCHHKHCCGRSESVRVTL